MYGESVPTAVNAGLPAAVTSGGVAMGAAGWFWAGMLLLMIGTLLAAVMRLAPRATV